MDKPHSPPLPPNSNFVHFKWEKLQKKTIHIEVKRSEASPEYISPFPPLGDKAKR